MKKFNLHNPYLSAEVVNSHSDTVRGQSLSVYELYQKMIVGSIDAAGYVHPVVYDENPDIDNPDILNQFGTTLDEVEDAQREASQTAKREMTRSRDAHRENNSKPIAKDNKSEEAAPTLDVTSTSKEENV